MTYAEIFAGIRGASVAWEPLGWECLWVSEIDPFASAVGAYHYAAPNLGDIREISKANAPTVDILIGGPPCQDFSVAGKRAGMAGDRGSLVWEYLRVADALRPRWLVFENVPGLLSSGSGEDWAAFLGALAERGYLGCYRVCDAQHFGVPQRRRRIFAVCHIGDWRPAAAVLLEPESLHWDTPQGREAGEGVAGTLKGGVGSRGWPDPSDGNGGGLVARPLQARAGNCSQDESRETFVAFSCKDSGGDAGEVSPPLRAMGHDESHANAGGQVAIAFAQNQRQEVRLQDVSGSLSAIRRGDAKNETLLAYAVNAKGGSGRLDGESETLIPTLRAGANQTGGDRPPGSDIDTVESLQVVKGMAVRRLLPVECEALQGFPRNYTQIPWRGKSREECPDGLRYRVLGNGFAVPVVRWIGERIAAVEEIMECRP